MLNRDERTLRAAMRAHARAAALHLYDPNVSHIDLGLRIRDSAGNRVENELVVRVHLRKKLRGAAFARFADQYPERIINAQTIGFPVDLPEARYRLHYRWWQPAVAVSPRARRFATLQGGISTAHAWSWGYGTLGGYVRDRETGAPMLLSNWHVFAGSWYAPPGLAIYQPARGDGGTHRDIVAHLSRDGMSRNIDAAVARLDGSRPAANEQYELGPVSGLATAQLGQVVTKSGRKSGVTEGVVTGINGRAVMRFGGIRREVRHIVHIAARHTGEVVSSPGDSGSWWMEKNSRRAIGLHFAGSNQPEYALAFAMPEVFEALKVELP